MGTRKQVTEAETKTAKSRTEAAATKIQKQREKVMAKIAERDERIAESRRRAEDDRRDVVKVGEELVAIYADPDELLKHSRVVGSTEIEENEFNLNIPRYVDTFEPEPRMEVEAAMDVLCQAEVALKGADEEMRILLKAIGYASANTR